MDWVVDNAIALSGIVLGAAVLLGLIVLVVSIVVFWRRATRARRRLAAGREALEASAERLADARARLEGHRGQLDGEIARLQADIETLKILARYTGDAEAAIGAPFRFVGIRFLGRR